MGRLFLAGLGLLTLLIAIEAAAGWRCPQQGQIPSPVAQPEVRRALTAAINNYSRPELGAYQSLPEWYIVWAYQEKADFQQSSLPGEFPYFASVRQYWNMYCCVGRLTKGKYPPNRSEQFAQIVIGTSFSAEYLLKGLYEETIGKISEWAGGHQFTEEDRYAAKVAQDYADFVHIRPFYEFQFARRIKGLWTENHFWGSHLGRKWERRGFLTLDYSIEAFYCWIMEKGTHLSYGYQPDRTYVWLENINEASVREVAGMRVLKIAGDHALVADAPRYQAFTEAAIGLSAHGARFVEIAGNSSITLSVLVPQAWPGEEQLAQRIFVLPLLTRPGWQRVYLRCDVTLLDQALNHLRADGLVVEHIYDY
jgi:hypothetical protein